MLKNIRNYGDEIKRIRNCMFELCKKELAQDKIKNYIYSQSSVYKGNVVFEIREKRFGT